MKVLRIAFLLAALAILAAGLFRNSHKVSSLAGGPPQSVSGPAFTEGTTYDAFVRKDGRVYDAQSLVPEAAQEKECST